MKKHTLRRPALVLLAMTLAPGLAWSQEAAKSNVPAPTASTSEDDLTVLSPFEVTTQNEGYRATDTLGGTRVRTKLADTPSSISVVTPKFLQDLGINDAQGLFIYTANTEVAGLNGNFSGVTSRGFGAVGTAEASRLTNPGSANRARGLTAMDSTRNYFLTQIPGDSFNISRWEIARGPNSFLFGVGSPSGINNVATNDAIYKDQGSVEAHYKSFSSTRQSLDYNKVLLPSELAFRLDVMNDNTKFQQQPAYSDSKRVYGALRFDPKIVSDSDWAHTTLKVNFEHGTVASNNPRELPPVDYITGYFTGVNKSGYDPFTYNPSYPPNFDPATSPWTANGDIHYAWGNAPTYYYDAATGALQRAAQAGVGGTGSPAGLRGNVANVYHVYTTGFSAAAQNANYFNASAFPGASAKTVNYLDKSLTDTSIFDFYNNLIDGPNKHEWQGWDSYNISLEQSFFNNRLTIQAVLDRQDYERGTEGLMVGNMAPYISVDLDKTLLTYPTGNPQAAANPNLGRPFIANDSGSGNNAHYFNNDNRQLTAAYSLNFDDFLGKGTLSKILGHHEFTALAGKYSAKQEDRSWQMYAMDTTSGTVSGLGQTLALRNVNWVSYLGPSLQNRSSASGAYLSNMASLTVPNSGPVSFWNNTWTAASTVNPAAAWTNPVNGAALTQLANPANYAGYVATPTTLLNSKSNIDQLYTSGAKSQQVLTSKAFMYQGYFWDDTIIPEFGVRQDKVLQRGNQAPIFADTGVASMNYRLTDPGVEIKTTSKSYGITLHLPKDIKKQLPEGMDVSVFYFHGANETPKVRYGIDGLLLPNEAGRTDDYGIQFNAFKDKLNVRVTAFKTRDDNAQASYGQPLGDKGWLIDSLPSWTLTMAAGGIAASKLPAGTAPTGMEGGDWYWGWGQSDTAKATRIAAAIQQYFPTMFPQSYWDQYGLPVNVAAIKSGDWLHVLSNGQVPYAWNINNSHMIHGTTPIIDQNIISKGYELEATIRPVSNWDIYFNASKVTAYQTSLGANASAYLNNMAKLWLGTDIGTTPEWGGSAISGEFMGGLWAPYLTQVALTGTTQPELSKWTFRGVSSYKFDRGPLKGVNGGVGYRWQSKPILGYGIHQATVYGNTAWISDVGQPLYGKTDSHFDLWIGYEHRLSPKIDWRIQLNLRNVGETTHLTPISVEPDGSWAQRRIASGMTYDLSTKFSF